MTTAVYHMIIMHAFVSCNNSLIVTVLKVMRTYIIIPFV